MVLKKLRDSNKTKGLCKLSIDEDFTIFVIDVLKQELSGEIDLYDRFELDLGDVEEIDSAGIQLLLAFRKELMNQNKDLMLTGMSATATKLMENYGVSERFNIRGVV